MSNTANTTTFATSVWSGYTPSVVSVSPPSYSLESIDNSHLGTTGFKTSLPADLQEIGEMTIVVLVPADSGGLWTDEVGDLLSSGTTFDATVGTITLTFPKGANTTAPKLTGTGYVTGFELGELNNDDQITATLTLQFDGETAPTYAVGIV